MASSMFSPANTLPYRRKLKEMGRNKIETISKQPAAKNTAIMTTLISPVVSPLGANNSFRNPIGPISRSAQINQQAKKTKAIASVRLTSAPVCARAWNETLPIGGENEDENGRKKKPKGSLYQVRADDAFQECVQT